MLKETAVTNYPAPAPTYLGPPAHTSAGSNNPVHRIVIHCTVSPCVEGGARDIARYFKSPASGGSAHYVVDPGEAIQACWDSVIAWHAPPNANSLGIELCDPMSGGAKRWGGKNHQAMLKRAAELVAGLCLAYDVPVQRLTVADLKVGKRGICGHVDVSQAFKQSTHWDPGPDFPWDQFMQLVRDEVANIKHAGQPPLIEPKTRGEAVDNVIKQANAIKGGPVRQKAKAAILKAAKSVPFLRRSR